MVGRSVEMGLTSTSGGAFVEFFPWYNCGFDFSFSLQALVIAGLADAARPAEKLSFNQSLALALTGKFFPVENEEVMKHL